MSLTECSIKNGEGDANKPSEVWYIWCKPGPLSRNIRSDKDVWHLKITRPTKEPIVNMKNQQINKSIVCQLHNEVVLAVGLWTLM